MALPGVTTLHYATKVVHGYVVLDVGTRYSQLAVYIQVPVIPSPQCMTKSDAMQSRFPFSDAPRRVNACWRLNVTLKH